CIYIDDKNENLAKFRLEILTNIDDIFDIQIYQLLPIYVQIEVLKGKVLYVKNIDFLYQIANETIEEFEDFYPLYLDYLNQ
ncbi:MAG: nucleotidyltransferase domain-containing protein, partial [Promethearchaeota archaeon]